MPRDRQASLVENIRMNTARLLSLVTQLLDLGKLRTGKLQLDLDPTDVHAMIQGAVDEIRPWAEDRALRLDVAVSDAIPKLLLDAKRVHQVLVNLLANAVKYSKAAGVIRLTAEVADQHVVVKVADTGIGIPAHLQATVFERYEQAHSERGGTGLGLAIVKGFVLAHGGRVWVESEEGVGSCFGFTLPLEARTHDDALVLLALLSLSACSTTTTWTRLSSSMEAEPTRPRRQRPAPRRGNPTAAVRILEDAVRRFPDAPSHDRPSTIWLARSSSSANGGRDYRRASAHLDRPAAGVPGELVCAGRPCPPDRPQRVRRAVGRARPAARAPEGDRPRVRASETAVAGAASPARAPGTTCRRSR